MKTNQFFLLSDECAANSSTHKLADMLAPLSGGSPCVGESFPRASADEIASL
jgi:hypothetical protein